MRRRSLSLPCSTTPILYFACRSLVAHPARHRRATALPPGRRLSNPSPPSQAPDPGLDPPQPMPEVPPPEGLAEALPLSAAQVERLSPRLRQFIQNRPIEFRTVSRAVPGGQSGPPRQQLWMRAVDRLPDDELLHRCLLAYASDFNLLGTALASHERELTASKFLIASIDHTMWFHRSVRIDDWLLYVTDSPSASGARGFTRGSLYARDGRLVASTAQEGLIRQLPPPDEQRRTP